MNPEDVPANRASAHGWQHRGAVDLVVAHEGGVSFGAEINAADGIAISSQRYLDTIRRHNPVFADKMLRGRTPTDNFFATVAAAERVNWVRCIGVGENGSGQLLAAVRAASSVTSAKLSSLLNAIRFGLSKVAALPTPLA